MSEIYNIEDIKNEFIKNTIGEYSKIYSQQQIDLAIYYLTDFVNNLIANELLLVTLDEPEPQLQQPPQRPMYQPPRVAATPYTQPQPQNQYSQNPFQEEEYRDPRTQRMRVDDFRVQQEVAEMNQQLRTPMPPRNINTNNQPQQPQQDVNLVSEKGKTFVDKIKDMRNPRKKEGINPDE